MGARACWLVLLVAGTIAFAAGRDRWGRPLTEPTADAAYYYAYVPSLVLDGDLDFANQYDVTGDWYDLGKTPTGRRANVFGVGPALVELPAFLVGHAIARIVGDRRDGFSGPETGLCLWLSVLASVAALVPATHLARRRVGGRCGGSIEWAAVAGPILAAFAGPTLYYAIRQPGYAHPFATLAAAWLVERWDASFTERSDVSPSPAGPRPLRTWLGLGALYGACVLARPQLGTWGLLFVFAAADDVRRRGALPWPRLAGRWLAAAALAFAVVAPQLVAWRALYGAWWCVPQGPGFLRWDAPAWSETLFSSRNGLFPWAPLYGPMLVGLCCVRSARARLGIALGLGLLAQALVNGAAWDWWAGGSFGGRRFDSTFILFALGAAAVLRVLVDAVRAGLPAAARWWRRALAAIAAVTVLAGLLITYAAVRLAADTDDTNARIGGSASAGYTWQKRAGGLSGSLAAYLSLGVTVLPRAYFAWRNDEELGAYDVLVGTHLLGETYPGLNRTADVRHDYLRFGDLAAPFFHGLAPTDRADWARMTGPTARIFVGINRNSAVRARIAVQTNGDVAIRWNGALVARKTVYGHGGFEVALDPVRRGVNWLAIEAPPGTVIGSPDLTADH